MKLQTNTLYILSGPPASGKSTLLKNLLESNIISKDCIVSSDELRIQILGEKYSLDNNNEPYSHPSENSNDLVFSMIKNIISERCKKGLLTFFDATNINDEVRKEYVNIAKKYNIDYEILIIHNDNIDLYDNNNNRNKKVKDHVINKFLNKFETTSVFNHRIISNVFDNIELEYKYTIDKNIDLSVVSDVHGLYDDLKILISNNGFYIENNTIKHNDKYSKLLFLGDIIDRGLDSIKTLKLIKNSVESEGHFLILGNHENKLIKIYEKYINGENTNLFDSSEAVSRTFLEFINLPKNEQEEIISFLNKCPHYMIYKDRVMIHANLDYVNPVNLQKQDAIYGIDSEHSDKHYHIMFKKGINKFKLIRGHIPIQDVNSSVISLDEGQAFNGNLCMLNISTNTMYKHKCKFNYYKEDIYTNRTMLKELESLKAFKMEKYDSELNVIGYKNISLVTGNDSKCGTMKIFKYGKEVFFKNLWEIHPLLKKARGLVLGADGKIIQHPFDKVFNYGENKSGLDISDNTNVIAVEKWNGFLGCITLHANQLLVTTTGSFDSTFTNYIKDFIFNKSFEYYDGKLQSNLIRYLKQNNQTLMFEVIHPEDPHIIKYDKSEYGLVLIGARGKDFNDKEVKEEELDIIADKINTKRAKWFNIKFGELKELVNNSKLEGYMVRVGEDETIVSKFKTPYYLTTKFIGRMSDSNIKFMYSDTKKFKNNIDEEYYELVDYIVKNVDKSTLLQMDNNSKIELIRNIIFKIRDNYVLKM